MPASRNQTIYKKSYSIKQLRKKAEDVLHYTAQKSYAMPFILEYLCGKKDEDLRKRRQSLIKFIKASKRATSVAATDQVGLGPDLEALCCFQ